METIYKGQFVTMLKYRRSAYVEGRREITASHLRVEQIACPETSAANCLLSQL
jgi:hypothetical protein